MRVIYITTYCGNETFARLQAKSGNTLFPTTQVFNGLFIKALRSNGVDVEVLTYLPVSAYPKTKIRRIAGTTETGKGMRRIPFLNYQFVKQICIWWSLLFLLPICILGKKRFRDILIVCDYLYLPTNLAALTIGRMLGLKVLVVMPDMPELIMEYVGVDRRIPKGVQGMYHVLNNMIARSFDGYLLFSGNMAKKLKIEKKRWMEIEGIYEVVSGKVGTDRRKNVALYAGGLYREYGIIEMMDSIEYVKDPEMEIWICGSGNIVREVEERAKKNKRIKYLGVLSQAKSVELQGLVKFVINPRPAKGEFTKYSFPSKTFEYLSSGAQVIMARLPGIPEQYFDHIISFEECRPEAIAAAINEAASVGEGARMEKAKAARAFVHDMKNPAVQGSKILKFLKSVQLTRKANSEE